MARVVTKYNPYTIQKLIQTSRVSTLQVVLVLGSISLLVGGLRLNFQVQHPIPI